MRRIHQARIGQRKQFVVQRIEKHSSELGGRPAQRRAQVGAPHVADEQRVAGEHRVRLGVARVQIENHDRNGFGRVARRFQHFQAHATEFEKVAVVVRGKCIPGLGRGAHMNFRAGAIAQLQMSGDKIGVQMGEKDVLNFKSVLGGKLNVLVGVALRINHDGGAGRLISNDVRRVRQTWQIELLEDHACLAPLPQESAAGTLPHPNRAYYTHFSLRSGCRRRRVNDAAVSAS